jgi:hypothetical protein
MLGSLSEADDAVQEAWLHISRSGTSGVENLGRMADNGCRTGSGKTASPAASTTAFKESPCCGARETKRFPAVAPNRRPINPFNADGIGRKISPRNTLTMRLM